MAIPLYTPRVNNNDDTVRLVKVCVKPGDAVRQGDIVAEVETDKANYTVEAEQDAYVLAVIPPLEETIEVGSVLMWLGATPDEAAPSASAAADPTSAGPVRAAGVAVAEPTLKAALLLARHGLNAADVPAAGDRLTVRDIEAFLEGQNGVGAAALDEATRPSAPLPRPADSSSAMAPGTPRPLSPEERGMLRTVVWQRDEAVPGYVELQYDVTAWEQAAARYQAAEKLLLNPLLSLMAFRLAEIAAATPRLNATIAGDLLHVYSRVNLGFTIQSGKMLYLVVVQDAASLTRREFVARLGDLQRRALGHKLRSTDLTGATVSFSSMARWNVTRHVPVLPPHTSLIVAHAAAVGGTGTLGATYDHRVLTGFDALSAIRELTVPEGMS